MSYKLPTFNLNVNVWRFATADVTAPPDVQTTGNLVGGHHGILNKAPQFGAAFAQYPQVVTSGQFMTLLLPKLADVRQALSSDDYGDCVEVPAGSQRYYAVVQVDDIGKGFANEHRFALIVALTGQYGVLFGATWNQPADWPQPIP